MSVRCPFLRCSGERAARVPALRLEIPHSPSTAGCCNIPTATALLRKPTGGSGPGCRLPGAAGETRLVIVNRDSYRWHRQGVRLFWTWKSHRRTGDRRSPPNVADWFRRCRRRIRLGAQRIHGELLKLGLEVSVQGCEVHDATDARHRNHGARSSRPRPRRADLFVVPTQRVGLFVLVISARAPPCRARRVTETTRPGRRNNSAKRSSGTRRRNIWFHDRDAFIRKKLCTASFAAESYASRCSCDADSRRLGSSHAASRLETGTRGAAATTGGGQRQRLALGADHE